MAGEGTKRIIDLTEAAETQSGDYIAIDSTGRGTRKLPAGFMATAEDLSTEQTARQTADATLDGKITTETQARLDADNEIGEQITALDEKTEADAALIQNPTKTISGALCSFTDGAPMPMVACTAEIVPKQAGSGTPSPDNVRAISGWESVSVDVAGKNLSEINETEPTTSVRYILNDGNLPNSDYVISFELVNATYTNGSGALLDLYDTNNVNFAYPTPSQLKRVTDDAQMSALSQPISGRFYYKISAHSLKEIRLQFRSDGYGNWSGTIKGIQLEHGATATDYSPTITPTTTTTSLGRTVYGGTLDVVSGVLTVDRAYKTINDFNWTYNDANKVFWVNVPEMLRPCTLLSSHYSQSTVSALADIPNYCVWNKAYAFTTKNLVVKDTRFTDASSFKTNMSGVAISYELATPNTYTLTGQEVSTLLGQNNIWANTGDVEITYRRDISIVINNLESALNG